MKYLLTSLLCVSLLANAALLYRRSRSPTTAPQTPPALRLQTKSNWAADLSTDWEDMLREGDPDLAVRLRRAGFPSDVIRELLRAELDTVFQSREDALIPAVVAPSFWQREFGRIARADPVARLDLRREKEALLKKLLTKEPAPDEFPHSPLYFLPQDTLERLDQIKEDYQVLSSGVRPISSNITFPSEREKIAYLENEKRKELAEVLTPEQLFEYDLRESDTADSLRENLAAFHPTETEFREIFRIKQEAETTSWATLFDDNSRDPAVAEAQQKLGKMVDSRIEELLGKERYAEYKRSQESDFRALTGLTERLHLAPEKASEAYAVSASLNERLSKLTLDPGTSAQSKKTVSALTAEAETKYRGILGAEGLKAYQQYGDIFSQIAQRQRSLEKFAQSQSSPPPPKR